MSETAPDAVSGLAGGFIRSICWREEIDSTNRLALQLATQSEVETPALVVADRQTAGRGRLGRQWFADQGGLTASFLLGKQDLPDDPSQWQHAATLSGLAVAEAIEWFIAPVKAMLKWPNDVYVASRKASGILVESVLGSTPAVVIGIGVNVATDLSHADAEVRERAISLSEVAGRPLDRWAFLEQLCERLAERLPAWRESPRAHLDDCRARCLLSGRRVTIRQNDRILAGDCLGLGPAGGLTLLQDSGGTDEVLSGEVIHF